MEYFLGQIILGGWNFAPQSTIFADGQILPINQNTALFSLFGTMYGGDGETTFGMPDFRGRVPMGRGNGSGLTPRNLGEKGGSETRQLITANMPAHNHTLGGGLTVGGGKGATQAAAGSYLGDASPSDPFYKTGGGTGSINGVSGITVGNTGNNSPFETLNPFQVITFCVVTQGVFPSRN